MNTHNKHFNNTSVEPRIGIDFGGVILPIFNKKGSDTQLNNNFSSIRLQSDAFNKIQSIVRSFKGKVWIISKAGCRVEELSRKWLYDNKFFEFTGVKENNLIFCNKRSEKMLICKQLKITHFIDDRINVAHILKETVPHLFLFGNKEQNRSARKWTSLVEDWNETHNAILGSLEKF